MSWKTLPITHRAAIPESYLDGMGHMNVMWYTHLFGLATRELFEQLGMGRSYFETNRAGAFALKQMFCYLAEVRAGEEVTIHSRLLGRSEKRLHVMHFMVKDQGDRLAATAEFLASHIDMATRRSSPFPAAVAGPIDRLVAAHGALGWEAPVCGAIKV
jgi:acyl-CoA thioester hydrolase